MFQKNVFSDFWIEWLLKKQISPQICTEVINLVKLLYFFNKISLYYDTFRSSLVKSSVTVPC